MEFKRVRVSGADAEEVAVILKIPALSDGGHGWDRLLAPAAELRKLRVLQLVDEMGYEVDVEITPR